METNVFFFFFQAEDGIRDFHVTGVQTCALPISCLRWPSALPRVGRPQLRQFRGGKSSRASEIGTATISNLLTQHFTEDDAAGLDRFAQRDTAADHAWIFPEPRPVRFWECVNPR